MGARSTYRNLACILGGLLLALSPVTGQQEEDVPPVYTDSVRVERLIVRDTLLLKIDGPSNDISFYMNGIVFLSNTKFHQKDMIPDHIAFGTTKSYFSPLEFVGMESSRPLFSNDDFPYSPAGSSFTRDYKTVYFTKPVRESGKRLVEKIFEMTIVNGEGSTHRMLPFCASPSRYLHPAISMDDSFMVFSSDQSPTSGGLDLFYVEKTPDGWSEPVNMGERINTSGHEWYPFLDQHNNLYFSSSGQEGFGGYDIFVSFFNGSGWDDPRNLSEYINSSRDELGFSIHPNNKTAVYSQAGQTDSPKGEMFRMTLNSPAFMLAGIEDERNSDFAALIRDLTEGGYTASGASLERSAPRRASPRLNAPPLLTQKQPVAETPEPEQAVEETVEETVQEVQATIDLGTDRQQTRRERREETRQLTPEPQLEIRSETTSETTPPIQAVAPEDKAVQPELKVAEPELKVAEEKPAPAETRESRPAVTNQPPAVQETPRIDVPANTDPDRVVFRVQILSMASAGTRASVTIGGTNYKTFEYYYKGAYRITVGEFATVAEALRFRTTCRDAGYSQAFVAAFRNNERELDPSVFKR
ncbi:MAG: hypothetical protein R2751_10775 [Bacteroidales bacterium]